jgi:hypothetical protein
MQLASFISIAKTGVMFWEEEDLDPVLKQYAKKYIIDEGFLEQALGALEPLPERVIDSFLDDGSPT